MTANVNNIINLFSVTLSCLFRIRAQDKKKKKRSEAVKRKFTGKKQPNPVKIALKAVEEYLQVISI